MKKLVVAKIVLPQSYLQRQAVSKKAGIFTFVTWSDVAERSIEFDEFRAQFASLHTENLASRKKLAELCRTFFSPLTSFYSVVPGKGWEGRFPVRPCVFTVFLQHGHFYDMLLVCRKERIIQCV